MAVRLRRPTDEQIAHLLAHCSNEDLTYQPVGCSLGGPVPTGLHEHRWTTPLAGDGAFERGRSAIEEWAVHRGSGLRVVTDGPLAEGTNVVITVRLPVGYVDAACRVVHVVDESDRFGFAYGTLPEHPERGEEAFLLTRGRDGSVEFAVRAVAAPAHPLARTVGPIADWIQDRAGRRYIQAMRAAAA